MDSVLVRVVVGVLVVSVSVAVVSLIRNIAWPTIIRFPWKQQQHQQDGNDSKDDAKEDRIVILAGSYNPPHRGHLAMLLYLSKRYRQVIAVVGFNPLKKYPVSPEQRRDLLREMLKGTPAATNVRVEVVQGYIWRYAKNEGASIFFRGIRSWEKDGKDERALQILNTWGPMLLGPLVWPIPTMFLEGDPQYNHVSSTLIRTICTGTKDDANDGKEAEALSKLVPSEVAMTIKELYCALKTKKQ